MKLPSGLVFAGLVALGLSSYSCANGDTVSGSGTGNSSGSNTGGTTGSNTGGTTGTHTGGTTGTHTGGTTGTGGIITSTGGTTGTHTGGTTGTGGIVTSTGGITGTGGTGTTGTGGSGSTATCIAGGSNTPTSALITNFSDAVASTTSTGDFTFGGSVGMLGGTSRFSSSTVGTLAVSGGMLTFTGTVAAPSTSNMYPYNGFVVYVNGPACVNANAYTGVSFTYSSTGACPVVFSFGDSDHTTASSDPSRGACTGTNCYASQFTVTGSGTIKMPFAGTPSNAGMPTATVDAAKLTGVQWQLQQPASTATTTCMGTVTVGDITFY